MNIPTTVRMDAEMVGRLDGLAKASGRSRAWIIKDALARYLDHETWFVQSVEEGRRAAAHGDVVSHGEVKDRLLGSALPSIRWSGPAATDLEEIAAYIARDDKPTAEQVARGILAAVERLSAFPGLGRPGRVRGTRELTPSGPPYVVV